MRASINFNEQTNGNYRVDMNLTKGCNVQMIIKGLQTQIDLLNSRLFQPTTIEGQAVATVETATEVAKLPWSRAPYQFTCIYCPAPVDVNNGQEICDKCLIPTVSP